MTDQRFTPPVLRDETEEAMFDLVPFTGAGWKVTDRERQVEVVGHALEGPLPEARPRAVAAPAVGGDQERAGARKAMAAHPRPPPPNRVDRKLGGVMVDADADPAFIIGEVVDPIGDRFAELAVEKVMDADRDRLPVRPPFATAILEVADQFLLLGIDRDRRVARADGTA